jgi:hypothetical protein
MDPMLLGSFQTTGALLPFTSYSYSLFIEWKISAALLRRGSKGFQIVVAFIEHSLEELDYDVTYRSTFARILCKGL